MKKYESRLRRLEEHQPTISMIGLRYQGEQAINWAGEDYPDWQALSNALEVKGLGNERFIILTHQGPRP